MLLDLVQRGKDVKIALMELLVDKLNTCFAHISIGHHEPLTLQAVWLL